MCVYIAIIAIILQVTLWCMDSTPALKWNGYRLESRLARHLVKGNVHWRGEAWYVNVRSSVQCGGVQIF